MQTHSHRHTNMQGQVEMHTDAPTHGHMDKYTGHTKTPGQRDTDGQTYMDKHTRTDSWIQRHVDTHVHR